MNSDLVIQLPLLATVAAWTLLGLIYLFQGSLHGPKYFLKRKPNYKQFSLLLLTTQIALLGLRNDDAMATQPLTQILIYLGLSIMLSGLALCAWAKFRLGRLWDWHASIQIDHSLVQVGPYRLCRNPIFLGQLGIFFGTAITSCNLVVALVAILASTSFYRRTLLEEEVLAAHFGVVYYRYSLQVPRFVPKPLAGVPQAVRTFAQLVPEQQPAANKP